MSESIEDKKAELKKELDALRHEFKIELPKKISAARSLGDLKENSDYHAAKDRQAYVKAKISKLNMQLSEMNRIDISKVEEKKVGFGSKVFLVDLDSKEKIEFTFVHPNEVKPSEGKISANSPIGAALNNRTVGEQVEASIPAGKKRYLIEKLITVHGTEYTME